MADEIEQVDTENKKNQDASSDLILPEEIKHLLADPNIPIDKRVEITKAFLLVSIRRESTFIGPIPPPEILRGYNDILPNGAERIVAMAEKQSNHRMSLEDHAIREELKQSRRGQLFGLLLGVTGLGLATVLACLGHETTAGIFGTTTIVGLVAVFVIGKRTQQKDLSQKDD
ncbi:MAG: DUF2335 domain-containing protein [Bacteroidia bacterium]